MVFMIVCFLAVELTLFGIGFVSAIRHFILMLRLENHLAYRRIGVSLYERDFRRWLYSEDDNDDPKIADLKSAIRHHNRVCLVTFMSCAAILAVAMLLGYIRFELLKG